MSPSPPLASWYCAATAHELARQPRLARPFCHRRLVLDQRTGTLRAWLDEIEVPVVVMDEAVMVWFHPDETDPAFSLPNLSQPGWSSSRFDTLELETRPELVMRDLADYGHFSAIHEYGGIDIEQGFSSEDHRCHLAVRFLREVVPGMAQTSLPSRFESTCWGVGYQITQVDAPGGIHSRHRVMPTPTTPGRCRVTLGVEVRLDSRAGRIPGPRRLLRRFVRDAFVKDVRMDARLWESVKGEQADRRNETLSAYWDWAGRFAA